MSSRLRDFVRLNPPIIIGSMVNENPLQFVDGVYKIFSAMVVTSRDKAEFASLKFRDLSQIWSTQLKDNRPIEFGLIVSENSRRIFLVSTFLVREQRLR